MKNPQDARLERVLATLALVVISLISLANVVVRYFTDASFAFTEELSVFLLVILTFAGASVAMRSNRHIRIGFAERLFPRLRVPLIVLQWLASVVVLGLVVWFAGQFALEEYQWESQSPGLGLPNWWYVVWLPLLALLMIVRLSQMTLDRLRGRLTDEP